VVDGVALRQMATLNEPIAFALRAGEGDAVFIAEKGGRVRRLHVTGTTASVDGQVVLDIQTRVSTGGEQGLLGIAFAPDGSRLYANYTNTAGDTRVVEYPYANGRADAGAERVLFGVDQPYPNHNGGDVVFGPDGYLYIGMGDGGSGGDPQNRAQNDSSLLGKLLRINATAAGAAPEIWAKGLRNPWRFSFDRANGDLWIADVGQNAWEEVNHVAGNPSGVNYGWNKREGTHAFNGGVKPNGAVDPVYEYSHNGGNCSITGGFVYRGSEIRGLGGAFVFADYCGGRLMATAGGSARDLQRDVASPISFGEDAAGELWVLSQGGAVYRLVRA
jgi:glucose/arabinose dehydrogenase